jgi:hypothetical protein
MKREEWDMPGSSLAVRSRVDSNEFSASLRRRDAVTSYDGHFLKSVRRGRSGRQDLNCLRQGTASAVPNCLGTSRVSTPEAAVPTAANYSTHVPSNFLSNSLKTKKSGTHYSTHKSRCRELHFRTIIPTDPSKLEQVQVN